MHGGAESLSEGRKPRFSRSTARCWCWRSWRRLGQAGVTEIAAELGVHKSTVSRLIAVLESRGYVEQVSERGKYRLGFAIARLAQGQQWPPRSGANSARTSATRSLPTSGETTNLAILDEDRIVNIVEAIGPERDHPADLGRAELPGACDVERQGAARRPGTGRGPRPAARPLESFTANTVVEARRSGA